jgi:hypothetical protein
MTTRVAAMTIILLTLLCAFAAYHHGNVSSPKVPNRTVRTVDTRRQICAYQTASRVAGHVVITSHDYTC